MRTIAMAVLASALTVSAPFRSPRELLTALMRADNTSDLEAVMAACADDAVLLPPNEPAVHGKDAIRARYIRMFATARMNVRFEIDHDCIQNSLGFLRGHTVGHRVSTDGARVEDLTGKFVMVLSRRGGGWKISSLIWNADR